MTKPRVCLAMMAKAPADIVLRAVESARRLVDEFCLVVAPGDPLMALDPTLPTRIVEQPWGGYAATRTLTLQHAESNLDVDWVLMIDAYARLEGELPPIGAADAPDAYSIGVEDCGWRWMRPGHLMRARRGFSWTGAIHETLVVPEGRRVDRWNKLTVRATASPKSSDAGGRTYDRDAEILAEQLRKDPTNTRAAFYYAQSLKDAGRYQESFDAFRRRAEMGGWAEEIFWALLWCAKLAPFIGENAVNWYNAASRQSPQRAEPWAGLASHFRVTGLDDLALAYGQRAAECPYPEDAILFVDLSAYSAEALASVGLSPAV